MDITNDEVFLHVRKRCLDIGDVRRVNIQSEVCVFVLDLVEAACEVLAAKLGQCLGLKTLEMSIDNVSPRRGDMVKVMLPIVVIKAEPNQLIIGILGFVNELLPRLFAQEGGIQNDNILTHRPSS